MDRKKYLKKGYRIKLEIESKKAVLEDMRATLDGLRAVRLSEKLQGGPLPSDESMVNRIDKIVEEEKKIEKFLELFMPREKTMYFIELEIKYEVKYIKI